MGTQIEHREDVSRFLGNPLLFVLPIRGMESRCDFFALAKRSIYRVDFLSQIRKIHNAKTC